MSNYTIETDGRGYNKIYYEAKEQHIGDVVDSLNEAIETIQSLQKENERVMEGLHQIRILEDSYDPEITVLSQIFDIVYKLENEVKDD